jgi:hypothetical protein
MGTKVVNVRKDAHEVYIGRAGHGQDGYFGNPFKMPPPFPFKAADVLLMFQHYFLGRVEMDPEFRRRVLGLKGKTLGCFCAPKGGVTAEDRPFCCHGQVIAEWVDAQE